MITEIPNVYERLKKEGVQFSTVRVRGRGRGRGRGRSRGRIRLKKDGVQFPCPSPSPSPSPKQVTAGKYKRTLTPTKQLDEADLASP